MSQSKDEYIVFIGKNLYKRKLYTGPKAKLMGPCYHCCFSNLHTDCQRPDNIFDCRDSYYWIELDAAESTTPAESVEESIPAADTITDVKGRARRIEPFGRYTIIYRKYDTIRVQSGCLGCPGQQYIVLRQGTDTDYVFFDKAGFPSVNTTVDVLRVLTDTEYMQQVEEHIV